MTKRKISEVNDSINDVSDSLSDVVDRWIKIIDSGKDGLDDIIKRYRELNMVRGKLVGLCGDVDGIMSEYRRYIMDNCDHNFVRDDRYTWNPYDGTPRYCTECGLER